MPFFSRNANVFSRICLLSARRSATSSFTFMLAVAQARPVTGRKPPLPNGRSLGEQIRPRHREARAEARHAVNLRERPQHDDILAGATRSLHGLRVIREVDVRLVDHHHGVFLLVRQQVLDILARRQGAGRIVRIADVIGARDRGRP